jgi:hypothetical protein
LIELNSQKIHKGINGVLVTDLIAGATVEGCFDDLHHRMLLAEFWFFSNEPVAPFVVVEKILTFENVNRSLEQVDSQWKYREAY